MNVGGVTANYSMEQGVQKTRRKGTGFAETIDRAAQDNIGGTDAENSGEKVVFRWLYSENGSTGEVSKTQAGTPEHPIYRVKSWDAAGNLTERVIDVSQVDPRNCDTYEMYAYTAHAKETGKGSFEETVLKTAVAKAAADLEQKTSGLWDYCKNVNWAETVQELMQSAYDYGDLKGYLEWKKFLGLLKG